MHNTLIKSIKSIVENGLKDKPIVIWYDEGETLKSLMGKSVPKNVNFIEYSGSYLAIRQKVEESDSHLNQKWFIYIGRARKEKSWLRDYELFGECIEFNLERLLVENFGLKSNAETKKLLSGNNGKLLAKKWDEVIKIRKNITLNQIKDALLSSVFETFPSFDVKTAIIKYLSSDDDYKTKLTNCGLHRIFDRKIKDYIGISCLKDHIVDSELLASALLLSEFVESSQGLGEEEFLSLIPKKDKREYAANLVDDWINNNALSNGFFDWSKKLSSKYNIKSKLHGMQISKIRSFKEVDEVLLEELIARITLEGFIANSDNLLNISRTRKDFLWSKGGDIDFWDQIYPASKLFNSIKKDMESITEENTFDDLIQHYTSPEGWWKNDEYYLELASDSETKKSEINEHIIMPISKRYGEWLNFINKKFSESLSQLNNWDSEFAYPQQAFWEKNVSVDDGKVVVLYIDALRYDLAQKLFSKLEEMNFKVSMTPMLSSLPSITPVGMAAMLPKNEGKLSLEVKDGKLNSMIKDSSVTLKSERENWIKKVIANPVFLDLNEILDSNSEDLKEKIQDSDRIFVMDQEIDKLGTFISNITVAFLRKSVNKIASVVDKLHKIGIKKVVIGTDHGFILLPKETIIDSIPEIKVNNLDTIKKHRFIIGNPPINDKMLNFDYESLGYNSKGKISFPRGINTISTRGKTGILHGGISLQENCIASIESIFEVKGEKVGIKIKAPHTITSVILIINISPIMKKLDNVPRKIKMELIINDKLSDESEEYELFEKPVKVRLNLRETPEEIKIQVKDVESEEILYTKIIPVELEGYDDIF